MVDDRESKSVFYRVWTIDTENCMGKMRPYLNQPLESGPTKFYERQFDCTRTIESIASESPTTVTAQQAYNTYSYEGEGMSSLEITDHCCDYE